MRKQSLSSAKAATETERKDAEMRLWSLAAKKFSRRIRNNPQWSSDTELKQQIVDYLNTKITSDRELLTKVYRAKGRKGITAKWLGWSKNRNGITSALKGGR